MGLEETRKDQQAIDPLPIDITTLNEESIRPLTLPREYYMNDTLNVLEQTLGKVIVHFEDGGNITAGRIIEAEAYIGGTDKASHSYLGKRTPRTEIQFGVGGHAYIFTLHTHHQFCLVTREAGISDVILIRAIEPIIGMDLMTPRRNNPSDIKLLGNGPGKLCASLGITKSLYGVDLTDPNGELILIDDGYRVVDEDLVRTSRVGIDYAGEFKDVPWRYYIQGNKFVSKK